MEAIVRAIKELMIYVLWAIIFGGTFLVFMKILMAVSY